MGAAVGLAIGYVICRGEAGFDFFEWINLSRATGYVGC